MSEEAIVIVGAGHAGVQAAVQLHELGWPGRIVIVEEQAGTTYERPPLSKEFLKAGAGEDIAPLRKAQYFAEKGIERVAGSVAAIDRAARRVELADGTALEYARLILAPGSNARSLKVPGGDLQGVHLLKTRDDAQALRTALRPGARVVIVGAGYIGLEVAAAAAALGCETTVLEFMDRVMSRVTSEPVSRFFEQVHAAHGTRFVFGAAVTELRGAGRVEEVVTADGASYPADVVVAGIGVVPRQELAAAAGLAVRDGILVDLDSRTSDPDIYAAGDATRLVDQEHGIDRRLESIQSAQAQAVHAAHSIMGQPSVKHEVPWFWTVQHGVRLQTAGLRLPEDEIVLRGDPAGGKFTVLYLREGRLAALDTVGSLADFTPGKKLVAAGAALDSDLASDPAVKLSAAVQEPAAQAPRP